MKAFVDCERRDGKKCKQGGKTCCAGQRLSVGKCWRMCEETDEYLQCPTCKSGLWFDNIANPSGLGKIFFCPKCDKDVSRSDAIQSIERLGKKMKEAQAIVSGYNSLHDSHCLSPRGYDTLNHSSYEVRRLKKMIIGLVEKQYKIRLT